MRKVNLGPLRVSALGIGLWQTGSRMWGTRRLGVEETLEIVSKALSHGINFFDTAEIYGWGKSERLLGESLRRLNVKDVIIASKIAGFRTTRYTIVKAAKGIYRRLQRAPDILQHHWPPPFHSKLCWIARGLEDVVSRGLAGYIGLSNYNTKQLEKILHCFKRIEPISIQIQYNLAYRTPERKLIPTAKQRGIGIIAWSPLAKGSLAGLTSPKTTAQRTDPVFKRVINDKELLSTVKSIADKHQASMSQVALAWLMTKGAIPIPGTRNPQRIKEYSGTLNIKLTDTDIQALDNASEKYLHIWGKDYNSLQWLRLIPSPIQYLAISFVRGV